MSQTAQWLFTMGVGSGARPDGGQADGKCRSAADPPTRAGGDAATSTDATHRTRSDPPGHARAGFRRSRPSLDLVVRVAWQAWDSSHGYAFDIDDPILSDDVGMVMSCAGLLDDGPTRDKDPTTRRRWIEPEVIVALFRQRRVDKRWWRPTTWPPIWIVEHIDHESGDVHQLLRGRRSAHAMWDAIIAGEGVVHRPCGWKHCKLRPESLATGGEVS